MTEMPKQKQPNENARKPRTKHNNAIKFQNLKSQLTERRRSSLIRLQGRIREKQQNKKGTDAGIEKIGNQALNNS